MTASASVDGMVLAATCLRSNMAVDGKIVSRSDHGGKLLRVAGGWVAVTGDGAPLIRALEAMTEGGNPLTIAGRAILECKCKSDIHLVQDTGELHLVSTANIPVDGINFTTPPGVDEHVPAILKTFDADMRAANNELELISAFCQVFASVARVSIDMSPELELGVTFRDATQQLPRYIMGDAATFARMSWQELRAHLELPPSIEDTRARWRRGAHWSAGVHMISGSSWNVPENFNSAANTVELYGGGGGGAAGVADLGGNSVGGGGGGGGGYRKITNFDPGGLASIPYGIGAGGASAGGNGGTTQFNNSQFTAVGGSGGSASNGGAGGSGGAGGGTTTNGSAGGAGATGAGLGQRGGGGGGGAGGIHANGGVAGNASGGTGGAGGAGGLVNGGAGGAAGGGQGGGGTTYGGTVGPGGGGGGGTNLSGGGNGGNYGGGGGGGSTDGSGADAGGAGAGGMIVITWSSATRVQIDP